MYVQVLPQKRWPHSLKTPMPQVDFPTGMQHWHSTRVQGVQGERLLTRKVTTFSTIYIYYIYISYIYILTWTFQPQQTFHQALPECWRIWQVVVQGMSHTCQCNTGCSKYLSSGVKGFKGPCSMAAIRFYSPVSVLLIMVLHSQAKLGSGINCFMLNVMKSLNLIARLLAWKHPITEFSLLPSWLWHPRTAAPETLVWHPFIIQDDHLEFERHLIFSES